MTTVAEASKKGLAAADWAPEIIGGANRDRTGDLYNAIVTDGGTRQVAGLRWNPE
jgi:hypothetical protein